MTDLWNEISRDDEAERTQRYLLAARVRTSHLVPLLAQATSAADYTNRLALVADRIDGAVAEAVEGDETYFVATRDRLVDELRADWGVMQASRQPKVAYKVPDGTPQSEADEYRNYVGQMAADSDSAYYVPIDFASWRRSYWDDSKGAPTYAPGMPPMASSKTAANSSDETHRWGGHSWSIFWQGPYAGAFVWQVAASEDDLADGNYLEEGVIEAPYQEGLGLAANQVRRALRKHQMHDDVADVDEALRWGPSVHVRYTEGSRSRHPFDEGRPATASGLPKAAHDNVADVDEADSVVVEQGPYQTLEQAKAGANYLVISGSKTAGSDYGEDGHKHKLKHIWPLTGAHEGSSYAECEICGDAFIANEYTHGEFEALEPAMASKTAADYKYNSAIRALYLKDGTFIADVMGTDPDGENPAGPTWVGFDADGNRRKWKAADIDRVHDAEYTLQTSWVDEQMGKQGYIGERYEGGDGQTYAVHRTGPNDKSPVHNMSDYDGRCGWCYLNASHSDDAHAEGIAKGVEPSLDPQGLVASFSAGYEAGWIAARVARVRTAALNETLEDTGYAKGVAAYWKAAAVGFEEYTPWAREYIDAWNAVYRQALQDGKSHAEAVDEADRVNGEPILAAAKKDDDKDKKPEDEDENSGWDDLNEGRYGSRKTAESNPYDGDSGSNPFAVDRPAAPAPKGPGTPDDALDGPATPEPVRVPTTTRPRGGEQIDMTPPPPAQPMMVTPVDPNQQVAAAKIDLQDPAVRSKILAIARSVTETNSGISWQEARDVAVRTVKAFPRMVQR